jgi:DNA-binding transcriptional ArsR family regulator
VEETGVLQGRLSSHLACLRWCGFVVARRKGRQVFYSAADSRIPDLLTLAEQFLADNADSVDICRVIADEAGSDGPPEHIR